MAMHITGDLSLADFGTLIATRGLSETRRLSPLRFRGGRSSSWWGRSPTRSNLPSRPRPPTSECGSRAVRADSTAEPVDTCRDLIGRYRSPEGAQRPSYLTGASTSPPNPSCTRFFVNSDSNNDYGTRRHSRRSCIPRTATASSGDRARRLAGHLGGDTWAADAAIAMIGRAWSGMFVTSGRSTRPRTCGVRRPTPPTSQVTATIRDPVAAGAAQTHVRARPRTQTSNSGRCWMRSRRWTRATGGETLVVLTADHGATYGQRFYGRKDAVGSNSNWYYAPCGAVVFTDRSAGAILPPRATLQSAFARPQAVDRHGQRGVLVPIHGGRDVVDRSLVIKKKEGAAAMLKVPGVIAAYWRDGDRFRLFGTNGMTGPETAWWKQPARSS